MQRPVTDDTCKSELVAASTCVEDLIWARKLIKELGFEQEIGKLFIDNQSTIKVCTDAGNFDGVKRYAKKSRKLAELVERKKIDIEYVQTSENAADMFTKALGPQRFEKLRSELGVEDITDTVKCRKGIIDTVECQEKVAVKRRNSSTETQVLKTEVDGKSVLTDKRLQVDVNRDTEA
ncbi:Copia-type Polyprotein [Phytophthora palmivora]|uniref:Copia-type Polyprotein n=1 Tax=Phytophthora palmivora TaxID=4796 RepID=A0A2P4X0B8_9STRA|nr:Copia-type Polyprotein [Phytophthora palmivora]